MRTCRFRVADMLRWHRPAVVWGSPDMYRVVGVAMRCLRKSVAVDEPRSLLLHGLLLPTRGEGGICQ